MLITLDDLKKSKKSDQQHRIFENAVRIDSTNVDNAINEAENTIWFVAVSDNNAGLRETWSGVQYIEQIDVETINTERFKVFAKDHKPSTDNVIGRVVQVIKEDGKLKAQIKFSFTDNAREVFQKYKEGILTDVSIGYRYSLEDAVIIDGEIPVVILRNVEVFELSSVWAGFDDGAKIGREKNKRIEDDIQNEGGIENVIEDNTPQKTISARVVEDRLNILSRRK